MAKMTTSELKERYYSATSKHTNLRSIYEDALERARKAFSNEDWDEVKAWLKFANNTLKECADLREEADKCKRELDSRKAVY